MRRLIAAAALALAAAPATAVTIDVKEFSVTEYNNLLGTFGTVFGQDFESFSEGNVNDGFATNVGSFETIGGTGSGGTITNADFVNDGSKLAIRDGSVYGRTSTTKLLTGDNANDKFLDSNDTHGIRWHVEMSDGRAFTQILLTLTDATDVGATMKITSGTAIETLEGLGNANKQIVLVTFSDEVLDAKVEFTNFKGDNLKLNDGFSLDDIAVATVPLPASVLLLGVGIAGLGAARKLRRRA